MKIQLGVHYLRIESDLSAEKTQQILEVLAQPGIIEALKRVPIERITIGRLSDKKHPAWYDSDRKSVSISSARKLGVHYGEEFRPGKTWSMSGATMYKEESTRRSLVQEAAHHMETFLPGVAHVVTMAWADPKKNPITAYARVCPEYFPESLAAYHMERNALRKYDPVGARMLEQAIAVMRQRG